MIDIVALGIGALVAAGLLFGGHYAFMAPRPALAPPWTYVYGVSACLCGMGVYCLVAESWLLPLLVVAGIFGLGGLAVFGFYHLDDKLALAQRLADHEAAVALLRQQYQQLREEVKS